MLLWPLTLSITVAVMPSSMTMPVWRLNSISAFPPFPSSGRTSENTRVAIEPDELPASMVAPSVKVSVNALLSLERLVSNFTSPRYVGIEPKVNIAVSPHLGRAPHAEREPPVGPPRRRPRAYRSTTLESAPPRPVASTYPSDRLTPPAYPARGNSAQP